MCDPGIRSRRLTNRDQVYNLLIPGIRESQSRRVGNYTDDEIDAVVDAYLEVSQTPGSLPSACISAAIQKLRELEALPLVSQRKAAHLSTLKSVSPAYRRSAIPGHFRPKETKHVSRQSPQAPDRDPNAAPDSGDAGAHYPGAGFSPCGNYFGGNYYTTSVIPNPYLVQRHFSNPFANTPPGGIIPVPSGVSIQQFNAATAQLQQAMSFRMGQMAAEPPPAPLPTEIKPGEIIAWRAWAVRGTPEGLKLESMSATATWHPGSPMTGDVKTFGVHAFKSEAKADTYAGMHGVVGEVELWGQVIEHEDGYRAEFGAVKSLRRPIGGELSKKNLAALRHAYGIEKAKPPRHAWATFELPIVLFCAFLIAACASIFAVTSSTVLVIMSAFAGILMLFAMLTADNP